ncbi:alpha/beta fold hydrolase [bacterium]|nr:alpha/beta fold hydrolase [bacterium]
MHGTTLTQTTTSDNLQLSALQYGCIQGDNRRAVVYVHGFTGDFYSWPFGSELGNAIASSGGVFLAIQTRGTGLYTEFLKASRLETKYIGSCYEILEEAYLDIDAWIAWLQSQGIDEIVLAGHSLGTLKVIRYLFEGAYKQQVKKIVLLGPFDKNAYVEKKSGQKWHEHVNNARTMIEKGKGEEIIPPTFDDFPMTYQTFYSWYRPSECNEMWDFYRMGSYDFSLWKKVSLPIQVISSIDDESLNYPQFYTREQVYDCMKKHIKGVELVVPPSGGHYFLGQEKFVAEKFCQFVNA